MSLYLIGWSVCFVVHINAVYLRKRMPSLFKTHRSKKKAKWRSLSLLYGSSPANKICKDDWSIQTRIRLQRQSRCPHINLLRVSTDPLNGFWWQSIATAVCSFLLIVVGPSKVFHFDGFFSLFSSFRTKITSSWISWSRELFQSVFHVVGLNDFPKLSQFLLPGCIDGCKREFPKWAFIISTALDSSDCGLAGFNDNGWEEISWHLHNATDNIIQTDSFTQSILVQFRF